MSHHAKPDVAKTLADHLRGSDDATEQAMASVLDEMIAAAPGRLRVRRSMTARFQRRFGRAAVGLEARGWSVGASRITYCSPSGNWAHFEAMSDVVLGDVLGVRLYGSLHSGTLLRLLERRPPTRDPDTARVDAHMHVVSAEVGFSEEAARPPEVILIPAAHRRSDHGALTPETATPWLGDLIDRFAAGAETWAANDESMRDGLLTASIARTCTTYRHAAVLSAVIGDAAMLALMIESAQAAWHAEEARAAGYGWGAPSDYDRTARLPLWSHERFVRFVQRDLPKRMRERLG